MVRAYFKGIGDHVFMCSDLSPSSSMNYPIDSARLMPVSEFISSTHVCKYAASERAAILVFG